MDGEACDLWLDFAQDVEDALAPGGALAAIDDWGAKLAGTAARIALLFELITSGADAEYVTAPSTAQAIALCRLLIPHARAAFHLLGADETARDVDAVLGWIRALPMGERGGFKQATLHYAMRSRFTKKERLVAALQRLQASACIRYERHKNDGARATDFWYVNPRLFLA
jgi:putative DNA primase/helicase